MLHSLVIPVYNEAEGLDALYEEVAKLADAIAAEGGDLEVILVNDGSKDGTEQGLDRICARDKRFKVLHFSRNFGHQMAITAGIEWASGATVSVMDADLQDPPEVILAFLAKWREGFEVVYGHRESRVGESWFKLITAKVFYRLIRRLTNVDIPVDTGDFRLMDRRAVEALLSMKERHRFVRGMVSWVGFRQAPVPYQRASRRFGLTHYPFRKMLNFAFDGITSFSAVPLQLATWLGLMSATFGLGASAWVLWGKYVADKNIPGWTSLTLIVLFLGGVQMLALGIIGEYLGRIYDEVKGRPLYLVRRSVGISAPVRR
jgi:dolichol-phosphate mannosyltransferase